MFNVIYFLSTKSQYDRMKPVLEKIHAKNGYKIYLVSFESWTNCHFLKGKTEFEFEFIVIPRRDSFKGHFRNVRFIELEYLSNLRQIQKLLKTIKSNKSILIKDYLRNNTLFGIESIIESFLPQIQVIIYVQKHLYSDTAHWSFSSSNSRSISKFILAFFLVSYNFKYYKAFTQVILKLFKKRFLLSYREIFCSFNQFEYNNLIQYKKPKSVFLTKNLYIDKLSKLDHIESSTKNIVFITSGAFKYRNKPKLEIELEMIRKINSLNLENEFNFYVKLKDGEFSNFIQYKSYLGLINSQIIDGESFNLFANSSNDIIITPIDSSIFLESIILEIPTFYYLSSDNKFLDLYSFLPLDSMNLKAFEFDFALFTDYIKNHDLELLKKLTLKEITSSVDLEIPDLIFSLKL